MISNKNSILNEVSSKMFVFIALFCQTFSVYFETQRKGFYLKSEKLGIDPSEHMLLSISDIYIGLTYINKAGTLTMP